jgi:RNA polymerase sigma-70 factor (ECF subfamily)
MEPTGIYITCAQYALTQSTLPDDLARRAAAGDREAFTELVDAYGPDVLRVCMLVTTDRSLAQDAAQETWQKAWARLHTLRDPDRCRAWLLRIAVNEAKQQLRTLSRQRARLRDGGGSEDGIALSDGTMDIRAALSRMASEDRAILAWRYAAGLTSDEIAGYVRLSPEGVRSRLKRIRDRLRKELE